MLRILALAAATAAPPPGGGGDPAPLNRLPQGALQSAFQVLRRDYIRRDELTFEELNRAALQGLLERLSFSAGLVSPAAPAAERKPAVHAEFLAPGIAYLRPETLAAGEAVLVEKEIASFSAKGARHLILDLRGTEAPGSFEEAALVLQCFIPAGEIMFKMKQIGDDEAELFVSRREPVWAGKVVVLADGDTNNAAETVAACLQARRRGLVAGAPTRGATVRDSLVSLDEKVLLRYASAEMLLPDGTAIFRKGIKPDLPIPATPDRKRKAFEGSRKGGMKPFVTDRLRPRFNEAALVGTRNPELDDFVRRTAGRPLPGDEGQVRDEVTQRVLDLLRSADLVEGSATFRMFEATPPAKP